MYFVIVVGIGKGFYVIVGHLASWPGPVRGLEAVVTEVMKEASSGARPSPVSSEP